MLEVRALPPERASGRTGPVNLVGPRQTVEVAVIARAKRVDVPRGGRVRRRRQSSKAPSQVGSWVSDGPGCLAEGSSETSRVHRFPSKNRKERCSRGSACQPRVSGCGGRSKGSSRRRSGEPRASSAVSAFAESGRWEARSPGPLWFATRPHR